MKYFSIYSIDAISRYIKTLDYLLRLYDWETLSVSLPLSWYKNNNLYRDKSRFWFGLVSLFNGISTLFRLFNSKVILLEEQYYSTHSWEDKGVHTFPKGICPKVNIIARLENELAYYDSAVHRFNHYTTRTPPKSRFCVGTTKYLKRWNFPIIFVALFAIDVNGHSKSGIKWRSKTLSK